MSPRGAAIKQDPVHVASPPWPSPLLLQTGKLTLPWRGVIGAPAHSVLPRSRVLGLLLVREAQKTV